MAQRLKGSQNCKSRSVVAAQPHNDDFRHSLATLPCERKGVRQHRTYLTFKMVTQQVARAVQPRLDRLRPQAQSLGSLLDAHFFDQARNAYKQLLTCNDEQPRPMLSGASRDRAVIVGWSTALRGQVFEFHREKCNRYKRLPASSVPKLPQLRSVIVRWSTCFVPDWLRDDPVLASTRGPAASFFGSCPRLSLRTWPLSAVDQPTINGRSRLAPDSIRATISL
jgi:hypothetical protein